VRPYLRCLHMCAMLLRLSGTFRRVPQNSAETSVVTLQARRQWSEQVIVNVATWTVSVSEESVNGIAVSGSRDGAGVGESLL
jgi:hypothetical protein